MSSFFCNSGLVLKIDIPKKMKFLILSGRLTSQMIYIFEIKLSFLDKKLNLIGTLKYLFLAVDQIMKKPMRTFTKYVSCISNNNTQQKMTN